MLESTSRAPLPVIPVQPVDPMDPATLALVGFLGQFTNPGTLVQYKLDLKIWFEYCRSIRVAPLDAKRAHVQAFVAYLSSSRGNGPATIQRRLGTVTGYYEMAVVDGFIEYTPCLRIRKPKVQVDPAKKTFFTRFEAASVMRAAKAAKNPGDWALMSLMITVGMRVTAVCDVMIEDISVNPDGYRVLRSVGKGGKISLKVLPIPVSQAVDAAADGRTRGPLILRRDGSQMTRKSAARVVERLAKAAGVTHPVSPHSCRRSFATLALQAGVDVRVVQDGMGHSSSRTTVMYDALGVQLHEQASHVMAAMMSAS